MKNKKISKENKVFKLPLYEPKYLTKNNLWDSEWLMLKYPNNFKNQINK
jgi:hypothetical protein